MQKKWIKILFFAAFSFVLAVPLFFSFTQINSKIQLKGAVVLNERTELNLNNWIDGKFQENFEKYTNDNIGFRPWMVRLRNQIVYSFFGKAKAAGVIQGKDNYLYELNYIKAHNGTDFLGADSIKIIVTDLKLLQDSLQKQGKTLLVCLAPGKGSYYPEFFPDNMKPVETDSTNYKFYARYLKEAGVNLLDYNRWFLQMKATSKYILYPRYGIHWSFYGMLLATDSLIHRVEDLRNADLPDLIIGESRLSKNLKPMDYDIADGMNLIFQLPTPEMNYPATEWQTAEGKTQPKTVVISDSFYWSMFGVGLWTKSFSAGGFWFYNRAVYPESFEKPTQIEDLDMKEEIEKNDLFILLVTEATLPKFPWGFTESALNAFDPAYENTKRTERLEKEKARAELQIHIQNIKANEKWMSEIRKKALQKNISVDSMLVLDATWMMEYKKSQEKNK